MTLTVQLQADCYSCALTVRDAAGVSTHTLSELNRETADTVTLTVTGEDCAITVTPLCDSRAAEEARKFRGDGFFSTIALRLLGKLATAVYERAFLRVACTYRFPLRERIGEGTVLSDSASPSARSCSAGNG